MDTGGYGWLRLRPGGRSGGALGETRRLPGRGGARARRSLRRPAPARLRARRPDRARRRDRAGRDPAGGGPAGGLDRRAGRRPLPRSAGGRTAPSSATPSARIPGSATCTRRPSSAGARARREPASWPSAETAPPPRSRFVGVRACELAAILVQDRVLPRRGFVDPAYRARREAAFVVAVNCGQAGGTCFCVSMGTGPAARAGFDLALTELIGRRPARASWSRWAASAGRRCASARAPPRRRSRGPRRPPDGARERADEADGPHARHRAACKELLYRNYEHPRWDEVAKRCLTCANCTMVCPTCFCTTVEDVDRPDGRRAERRAAAGTPASRWSSPTSTAAACAPRAGARYRQWLTHKLATWHDQFGTSGCVGCGRCITWCPVGIDITEEARALRQGEAGRREASRDDGNLRDRSWRSIPSSRTSPRRTSTRSSAAPPTSCSTPGEFIFREGQAADRFYLIRAAARWRSRSSSPDKGPVTIETARGRRGARLVVALPALPVALRRAGAERRARAVASTAPACATKCEEDPDLGYELLKRFAELMVAAPRGDAPAAPGRLWQRD